MAVSAIAISVVVRNATIEAHFPGGMLAFARSCPNQTFCTDGTISRVGFMVQQDAETFELIGLKANGTVEVYRHKTTGELRYVGRPFNSVRKWWQFWKRPQEPLVDANNHNQVYQAAVDLIQPYVEHHLEQAPLNRAARKQLRRGCEMLSRVV